MNLFLKNLERLIQNIISKFIQNIMQFLLDLTYLKILVSIHLFFLLRLLSFALSKMDGGLLFISRTLGSKARTSYRISYSKLLSFALSKVEGVRRSLLRTLGSKARTD